MTSGTAKGGTQRLLLLMRHGARADVDPAWRSTAKYPDDPGLSRLGIAQSREMAATLCGKNITAVYASPFLRAVETADIVAQTLGLPVRLAPDFGEQLGSDIFSRAPVLTPLVELRRRFPKLEAAGASRGTAIYPESEDQAAQRAAEAALECWDNSDASTLLVGHQATVCGALRLLTGRAPVSCEPSATFELIRYGDVFRVAGCLVSSATELSPAASYSSAPGPSAG